MAKRKNGESIEEFDWTSAKRLYTESGGYNNYEVLLLVVNGIVYLSYTVASVNIVILFVGAG